MAPQPQKSAEQQKRERADAKDKRIRQLEKELAEEKRQHRKSCIAHHRTEHKLYRAEAAILALSSVIGRNDQRGDYDDLVPF
ncbi:MAG: hypothetical protein ACK4GT_00315 [Pararhodobacter sp.]